MHTKKSFIWLFVTFIIIVSALVLFQRIPVKQMDFTLINK